MAVFTSPEASASNPPETWEVVKVAERLWRLTTADGAVLDSFTRKSDAEAAKTEGWLLNLYLDEARWYAGESVRGWKPYAELKGTS